MGEKEGFNIFKFFAEYDKRLLYASILLVIIIPLLNPFAMPIAVSADTKQYYDVLKSLKPGDKVLYTFNCEPSGFNELQSGILATLRILINQKVKIAIGVSVPEAVTLVEPLLEKVAADMKANDYQYGRDYVFLGYVFPNDASVAAAAQDWHSAIRVDYYGKPIKGTFLDSIKVATDWQLITDFATGWQEGSFRSHFALRGTPMIQNCIGVMISMNKPYIATGILDALLQSMRGGAELEFLVNAPGPGLAAMNSFSLAHYLLIIFIVIGNIGYFMYTKNQVKR